MVKGHQDTSISNTSGQMFRTNIELQHNGRTSLHEVTRLGPVGSNPTGSELAVSRLSALPSALPAIAGYWFTVRSAALACFGQCI